MTQDPDTTGHEANSSPFVSVVIPCHNEERWIGRTLEAVLGQTYPRERFEVLVVDNGSSDRTVDETRRFPIRLLAEPIRSSYRARNRGVSDATGEFVAFLDADCIPSPTWLERLVRTATGFGSPLVAGAIENQVVRRNYANLLLSQRRAKQHRREAVETRASIPGGNVLVAARLFDEYGLFVPTRSGADGEFSRRVARHGETISYDEDATVVHQCDLSNWDYLRRTFRIHCGQNQLGSGGLTHLLERLVNVPWRPGIRAPRVLSPASRPRNALGLVGLWLYMWADRWAGYAGAVVGSLLAFRTSRSSTDMAGARR